MDLVSSLPSVWTLHTRREGTALRKVTLSGAKRAEAFKCLTTAILDGDMSSSQRWAAELTGSHSGIWALQKLATSWAPMHVGMGAPRMGSLLVPAMVRAQQRMALVGGEGHLSNDASFRLLMARVVGALCLVRGKQTCSVPKVRVEDFQLTQMAEHTMAGDTAWAQKVLLPNDPHALAISVNELAHHTLRSRYNTGVQMNTSTPDPQWWLQWFLEWVRWREGGGHGPVVAAPRGRNLPQSDDPVWILWELALKLADAMADPVAEQQIQALRALFAWDYRRSRRMERRGLLALAFQLLAQPVDWSRAPVVNSSAWASILASEACVHATYQSLQAMSDRWEEEHALLLGDGPRIPVPASTALPSSPAVPEIKSRMTPLRSPVEEVTSALAEPTASADPPSSTTSSTDPWLGAPTHLFQRLTVDRSRRNGPPPLPVDEKPPPSKTIHIFPPPAPPAPSPGTDELTEVNVVNGSELEEDPEPPVHVRLCY